MAEVRSLYVEGECHRGIEADLRLAEGGSAHPLVVVCHGFKAFRRWGFFPWIGEALARAGAHSLVFDFSHNGVRGGGDVFNDLDGFAENTIARELSDVRRVLRWVRDAGVERFSGDVFVLGHSRGGAIALLAAETSLGVVRRVATMGTFSTFARFTERQRKAWRDAGYTEAINTRTGQAMRMNVGYLDDLERNAAEYSLTAAIARLSVPTLLVHGEHDLTVNIRDAYALYDAAGGRAELVVIPKTGHTFGAAHPFEEPSAALLQAMAAVIRHFGLRNPGDMS